MPNATPDFLGIVAELNVRRMRLVVAAMAKRTGRMPQIPQDMLKRMILARHLHHRFRNDAYEATTEEWQQIKVLCQWLVRQHDEAQGKTARTEDIEMPDATAFSAVPTKAGMYGAICTRIASGNLNVH